MLHSAYLARMSTPLRSTSASVSWNCTPWNDDSVWPNCLRRLTCAMVSSIARSSMPSSVQHGSTSPSATSPAPCVVDRGQLELGDERRDRPRPDLSPVDRAPSSVTAAQRDSRPASAPAGRLPATTISPSTSRSVGAGQPFGDRVGQRPVAGAAAQRRGGLEPVGVGAGIEFPRAELGEDGSGQRLPEVGFGLGLLHQLVAAGGLERPKSLAAILFGVVARSRIISLIWRPPAGRGTAGCAASRCCRRTRWRPASTSSGPRPRRGTMPRAASSCDTSAAMSISTSALSWSSLVTAIRYAAASPGWMRPLLCSRHHAVRQQPGPAAVRQHADPPAAQLGGQVVPAVAEHGRAPRRAGARTGRTGRCRPARTTCTSCTIDQPSSTVPSTSASVTRRSSKNTSLRWCGPIMQRIGRTWIAGSSIGTRKIVRPCCFFSPLRRAGQQEAPLRHGGVGRPDLLAADQPAVAVAPGRGSQRGEVGAGLGLGEALAPDHLAARDGRQVLCAAARRCRAA